MLDGAVTRSDQRVKGELSPCVARQYSGTLGKTGNCQIGVSVQVAPDTASLAADWRLFCPASSTT